MLSVLSVTLTFSIEDNAGGGVSWKGSMGGSYLVGLVVKEGVGVLVPGH